jgi:hypothetical protein
MERVELIIQILAAVVGCLAALVSIPLFFRFRWPAAAMWGLKVYVSALSPVLALIGLITAIVGLVTGSTFISLLGIFVVFIFSFHLISITRPPDASTSIEKAFGVQWENNIKPEQEAGFLPSRTTLQLPVPVVLNPRLAQNIAFATIPGTDRQLLCDVWQPP